MPNPGFLLAEDAALKDRLSKLEVKDDRDNNRKVDVFFRYPDGETEKHYPFITIELLDITHARSRQHSEVKYYYTNDTSFSASQKAARSSIDYFPSEYSPTDLDSLAGTSGYISMDQFIPMDLMYQVSTYCRSQRHDRQLTQQMLRYVFPLRRGFIEIPEDNTMRRCDLLDWRNLDVLDQESGYKKRIFRKVYTVQINAEIPQSDIFAVKKVLSINGDLVDYNYSSSVFTNSFSEEF